MNSTHLSRKAYLSVSLIAATLLLGACASSNTQLVSSWSNPSYRTATTKLKNIVVAVKNSDPALARSTQDTLAAQLSSATVKATPAYKVLGGEDISSFNKAEVQKQLQAKGYDGLLLIGLAKVDSTANYTPPEFVSTGFWGGGWGAWGGGFGTYGGPGWGQAVYVPGNYSTTEKFFFQGSLYGVKSDALVWMGQTETDDPNNTSSMLKNVAGLLETSLAKSGVLGK